MAKTKTGKPVRTPTPKLTPETEKLIGLAEALELALLSIMRRSLQKWLKLSDEEARHIVSSVSITQQTRRLLAKVSDTRTKLVVEALTKAHKQAVADAAKALAKGGIATTLEKMDSKAAMAALADALSSRLGETDMHVLRTVDDIYRKVMAEATSYALADNATRLQAAQRALYRFAGEGITGFVDSAGRQWNLASYTEMAARTSIHNAARQGVIDGVRATGRDLVMISGSPACCDLCAPWEGQVVSLDCMTTGYPTLSDAEADGVFHPGCRHTVAPYVEGLTRADYYQQGDPERYAAEQQQRYLERGLRQWKRREALALDPTQAQLAQNKIGEWRRRLEEHVTKHDLPREREREQISKAI